MNRYLKIGLYVISMLVLFWIGYVFKYSMGTASDFEVNKSTLETSVLIATQKSEYKDAITQKVIKYYKNSPIHFKVIDISGLESIDDSKFEHIIIVHTWEYSKPPKAVRYFIQSLDDKNKVFTLSTSGDGSYRYDEVDGVSSASRILSVENDSKSIITWIDSRLPVTP